MLLYAESLCGLKHQFAIKRNRYF